MPIYRRFGLALIGLVLAGHSVQAQTESNSDPVIEQARKAAAVYVQSLPKYLVQRTTTRSVDVRSASYDATGSGCSSNAARGDRGLNPAGCQGPAENWRTVDVVTADIVTDHGHEIDMNLRVNGAPATETDVDRGASCAEGDFDGALQAILAPSSAASFTKKRSVTLAKRPAWRYEYSIDQVHSDWHLSHMSMGSMQNYAPAFGGVIWIDQETSRVLRFEMEARNLPAGFPMDKVQWAIDYDFVKVGNGTYLLPKHSHTDNCQRNISRCTRNVTDFQNYKEFSADTSVSFDSGK